VLSALHYTRRLVQLFAGLFLFGFAAAMMLRASLGVDPWTVFAEGIHLTTGLGFGWIVVLTSGVVLLFWIPLRQNQASAPSSMPFSWDPAWKSG